MQIPDDRDRLVIPVVRGHVLGVGVMRGYARLCDLAALSAADIYDQKTNPTGTQRDLLILVQRSNALMDGSSKEVWNEREGVRR
jgi:hypothetical protein